MTLLRPLFFLIFATSAWAVGPDKLSIEALASVRADGSSGFQLEFERDPLPGMTRSVVSFTVDGLEQFALVLRPDGEPPPGGWPILLANHGYHPDPPMNGRVADGSSDRPGDYYRGIPEFFARSGFIVVWPDFRGHNVSEGLEFTDTALSPFWYARDVAAAFGLLGSLENGDLDNVFLWGHSMGGGISLRVALALGSRVRATSIWSPGFVPVRQILDLQSSGPQNPDTGMLRGMDEVESLMKSLPFEFQPENADPLRHLDRLHSPILIQHSTEDPSTPFSRAIDLVTELHRLKKSFRFESYQSNEHLFRGERFEEALQKDMGFYRIHIAK